LADYSGNSAFVKQTLRGKVNEELYNVLYAYRPQKSKFIELADTLHGRESGLLVIDTHPSKLNDDSFILFVTYERINQEYPDTNTLFKDLVDMAERKNDEFIKKVTKKEGFFDKLLDSIILNPNFAGIGININNLFKKSNKN